MPPRDTQGWSLPRTSSGPSSASSSPALATFRSPLNTAPAMISACARLRLSASPRATSSKSARCLATILLGALLAALLGLVARVRLGLARHRFLDTLVGIADQAQGEQHRQM